MSKVVIVEERRQLQWCEHVVRMGEELLPKRIVTSVPIKKKKESAEDHRHLEKNV